MAKDKDTITIVWSILDVISRAQKRSLDITEKQARKILYNMKRGHDASLGINWDVIDAHLDFIGDPLYINYYKCKECDVEWQDVWTCKCEDECPSCEKPYTPYKSEEVNPDS